MSAEIVNLADYKNARLAVREHDQTVIVQPSGSQPLGDSELETPSFQFWTGASGVTYVHSIYSLFECPPISEGNYILVKRHSDGQRTAISIGRVMNEAPTLNLAEIRLRSAQLGANEVHVHLLADSWDQSQIIEADLRNSLVTA